MKKCFLLLLIILSEFELHAFDFNGVWSCMGISVNGFNKSEKKYSWGKIKEPKQIGFTIDLKENKIYTNCFRFFLIDIDYNEENQIFTFINPLSNLPEKYSIKIISDYEILLETDTKNSLIFASKENEKNTVHYFKIDGPKDSPKLSAPVYAKLLDDVELKFKDYKGTVHNFGLVKKGTIVEVVNYYIEYIPEISDMDFNYHILVNSELGGCVDPRMIEFLDDITINGYGGKK